MAILDLIFLVHITSFVCYATQVVERFHILLLFSIIIHMMMVISRFSLPQFFFLTFISIPQHLPVSISLSIVPCSTVSALLLCIQTLDFNMNSKVKKVNYICMHLLSFVINSINPQAPNDIYICRAVEVFNPQATNVIYIWSTHS